MRHFAAIATIVLSLGLVACSGDDEDNNANNTTGSNNGTTASNNGTVGSNNGTVAASDVGKRCTDDNECAGDLICFTEFFGERGVCTMECGAVMPCPDDSECVGGISDYNSVTLGPRCVKSCEAPADCTALGSECDMHETTGGVSYCF